MCGTTSQLQQTVVTALLTPRRGEIDRRRKSRPWMLFGLVRAGRVCYGLQRAA